ncbi:DNA mismatch repair endonuclease MutL [bacterium]|nr:MAG: DNA mismatch repair endonuclease MutL [bacterium]
MALPPIRPLDDLTIARIAAGEVVERPSSVVKELIENSLDAGATDVRVEVQAGGRRLIRVADDGTGIPADQVSLAFQKHATSKIRSSADLERVATLGFRGEALASIASVCHVTLVTRARDEPTGTRIRIDNGQVLAREPVGAAVGTVITAENLFNAVPARLKFLRNEATEAGHIHDVVVRYALAYPERRFLLVGNGRPLFQSPGTGELEDTLIAAFGIDVARQMLTIQVDPPPAPRIAADADDDEAVARVRVRGYVGPPHVHRATRRHVTLFVNGRWVHDTHLGYAVAQAYHTLIPKGRHPVAVVMIEVPPAAVDVNVHPAKTEVRFRDGRPVFAAVQRAVRAAVVGQAPVAPMADDDAPPPSWPARGAGRLALFPGFKAPPPPRGISPWPTAEASTAAPAEAEAGRQATFLDRAGRRLPVLRVIGQLAQMYVLAEGPEGLYLVDQHAAHERVMYERFMARRAPLASQPLLVPEPVALDRLQLGAVEEHAGAFADLGFDVEPFGPDAVVVRALPEVLVPTSDVAALVRTVIDATAEGGAPVHDSFEARLVRAVCKQATVKAGQTLTLEEMRSLVRDLEDCQSPRTCPHGRPTMIVLTADRLFREFGRG